MSTHDKTAVSAEQMKTIRYDNLLINFTTELLRIWDTTGSRAKPAAFWRPTPPADVLPGFFSLGDVVIDEHKNISGRHVVAVVCEDEAARTDPAKGKALARPDDYELIWKDSGSGSKKDGAIWRPVPPEGYVALGSVCSDGHDKPSFNAIRCVRADLVIASASGEPLWSDKGSGARQSICAWGAIPPVPSADEIHLAPGTFLGFNGYSRPAHFLAYSLRFRMPVEDRPLPPAPVLEGVTPPSVQKPEQPTGCVRLPWFTVKDPQLSPPEQLRNSPFYDLQRTDHYQLVGHSHNRTNATTTSRWTVARSQRTGSLLAFSELTSIEFDAQWQNQAAQPFQFKARLNGGFTRSDIHSNQWHDTGRLEVAAIVPRNSALAVYVLQSDYTLLRADGSRVTSDISHTDCSSLHFSEYTPPEPTVTGTAAEPVLAQAPAATDSAP
ncbi:Vps62-related protein [Pseudomonas sp. SWRI81]|uniref:Vps62-related protein n=1 Tax=Pseudomonas sp. SWRI81 TaxID=2745505 RepID=UPI001646E2DC|nr:Vps62-related protein [Pseudomonas sp. SWRI81]MBC3269541.1 Vps62-related protein [Pseudomonas sp. SWRI81]